MAIRYRVDQIIVGVVINLFVLGLTSFMDKRLFGENPQLNQSEIFKPIEIPLLSDIPFFGTVLFKQSIFVYVTLALVAFLTYALFNTKWGLRARAVGEHPEAAEPGIEKGDESPGLAAQTVSGFAAQGHFVHQPADGEAVEQLRSSPGDREVPV